MVVDEIHNALVYVIDIYHPIERRTDMCRDIRVFGV
jgi:hypothetical protein